jgi:hypothetical protein
MARIVTSGGEIRDHPTASIGGPDGYSGGAAATTTELTTIRSGKAAINCPGTSANTAFRIFPFPAPSAGTSLYARVYFRVSALPNATKIIARFTAGATNIVGARLTSAGKLQLFHGASTQIGSDSTDTIAVDRWYRLELKSTIGTGATDSAELRVATDESYGPDYPSVEVASGSSLTITDTQPTELRLGWVEAPGVTSSMFLDDIAVNDSTGTKQTGHAGEGKVVYLLPTLISSYGLSSSCKATDIDSEALPAVSNLPPAGHDDVNDTAHSPHHLRNASNTVPTTLLEALGSSYAGAGVSGPFILPKTSSAISDGKIGAATTNTVSMNGQKVAQAIKASGSVDYAEVYLHKVGSPTDDVIFELQSDSSGLPSGTVLATHTLAASDVTSTPWYRLEFGGVILEVGNTHWIVARRSGSLDDSNVIAWQDSSLSYGEGKAYVHDGTAWQVGFGVDRALRIFVSDTSTIRLVYAVACHAEAISTGTKSGNLSVFANPAIAATAVTYGDNAGAATAYPGTWRWSKTAVSYDPTLASHAVAPVIKLTKEDGTTRVAMCCALGAVVEYIPPESPGWQQYQKASDSSLWWAKYVSSTTVFQWGVMGASQTEVMAGDYALHADPLSAEEADMGEITSVDRTTLEANYTKV